MKTAGDSSQFDDLIMDPEGASEGPAIADQGYSEDSGSEEGDSPKAKDSSEEEIETWDNLDPNSPIKQLDDKEDKEEDGKEDNKEDKEAAKEDDKSKEDGEKDKEDDKDGEEPKSDQPQGKTLKLFQDGKKYEVPSDATVKVKVDGRWEKVSVSELRDNYSGKQAWDRKFSEIDGKDKTLQAKEAELTRVQSGIKTMLTETKTSLTEALNQGLNPMEAVNKIVDMLGIDSYDFNKALFDSMTEELVTLDQMDEYERKAYWLEKKTSHLQKKHESFEENLRKTQAQEERLSKVDQMREAHGVSEEDFVSAHQQLSKDGRDVSPEQVIQYAANLPFLETAEELLSPYEDQLSDDEFEDMMAKVAQTMKSNRSLSKDDVATYLAELYEVEDLVGELKDKAGRGGQEIIDKEQHIPSQADLYSRAAYESFEDFDI